MCHTAALRRCDDVAKFGGVFLQQEQTKNVCEVCRAACMRGNGKRLPCARAYDFEKSNSAFSSTPAAKVSFSPLSTGHSTRGHDNNLSNLAS